MKNSFRILFAMFTLSLCDFQISKSKDLDGAILKCVHKHLGDFKDLTVGNITIKIRDIEKFRLDILELVQNSPERDKYQELEQILSGFDYKNIIKSIGDFKKLLSFLPRSSSDLINHILQDKQIRKILELNR